MAARKAEQKTTAASKNAAGQAAGKTATGQAPVGLAHTRAVVARHDHAPDPRVRRIMQSLIRHAHDFVRDVELTEAEWFQGIQFLTRTGHKCDDRRQEFILLSDTLGISMLVDAINHQFGGSATESTVFGPFHVEDSPQLPFGGDIRFGVEGEETFVHGRILDAGGQPIAGASIEVWQVRPDMRYDVQDPEAPHMQLRGTFHSNAEGQYAFRTVKPVTYPIPDDGPVGDMLKASARHPWRPAHIHFRISAKGYETLVTHIFVKGDAYLESDAVFGVKDSLIVEFLKKGKGSQALFEVEYDFHLARKSRAGRARRALQEPRTKPGKTS